MYREVRARGGDCRVTCKRLLEECLSACKEECIEDGLDVECRWIYRDCLANPENLGVNG